MEPTPEPRLNTERERHRAKDELLRGDVATTPEGVMVRRAVELVRGVKDGALNGLTIPESCRDQALEFGHEAVRWVDTGAGRPHLDAWPDARKTLLRLRAARHFGDERGELNVMKEVNERYGGSERWLRLLASIQLALKTPILFARIVGGKVRSGLSSAGRLYLEDRNGHSN